MPRFQFLKPRPRSEWIFFATFLLYAILCLIVYFWLVQPWINGDLGPRVGADSDRYWQSVTDIQTDSADPDLVTLGGNLLGPVAIGLLLKSGFAVMCFNFLLFAIALKVAFSIEGVNKAAFGFLMLVNAELLPALTTLNKEIFALLAAVLSAKYIYSVKRSRILLAGALVVSLAARWEQFAILLLFLLANYPPFRGRPKFTVGVLIGALTVIYPLMFIVFGISPSVFDYLLEGAGVIVQLDAIQAAFGFPIVLPIKVLMLMAGRLLQPWFYWSGAFLELGFHDLQGQVFQPLGAVTMVVIFATAFFEGKMRLERPIALLSAITLIVAAVAPFIQGRYAYPVYILLSLELAKSPLSRRQQGQPLCA
jgi:hypothetical protein